MCDKNSNIAFEGTGHSQKDEVDKGACIRNVLRTAETSIREAGGLPYLDVSTSEGNRYLDLRGDCPDTNFYTISADLFASVMMLHRKNVEQDQENQNLKIKFNELVASNKDLEENLRVLWSELNELKS